jgi:hypothetical protein
MTLTVAVVFPDLLGTYGDGGNGVVLARRAAWRGIDVELVEARSDTVLPTADVYCLGGGEDGPQERAAELLRGGGVLERAVGDGAVVLAVCAGYQIVGRRFAGVEARPHPGVGLLDVTTSKGTGRRAVGEIVVEPSAWSGLPSLTGFENHSGVTSLGPDVAPLGRTVVGVGNGTRTGEAFASEGARAGRVVGTYLHGPVLARNPAFADLLLGWCVSGDGALAALDDHEEEALRQARLDATMGAVRRGVRRWRAVHRR